MILLSRTVFGSPVGKYILLLIFAIILVVAMTAYGQIRLNTWNRPFYDALSRRDLRDFLFQLGVFFLIAFCLLILNVVQRWMVETLEMKSRQGLVLSLLQDWMLPRRAFWLTHAGPMGVNPDQRIHEDAR
jgi:vitamin B12/bleomycin/antimicrobial peptide transport system ATP-binding/permease protein